MFALPLARLCLARCPAAAPSLPPLFLLLLSSLLAVILALLVRAAERRSHRCQRRVHRCLHHRRLLRTAARNGRVGCRAQPVSMHTTTRVNSGAADAVAAVWPDWASASWCRMLAHFQSHPRNAAVLARHVADSRWTCELMVAQHRSSARPILRLWVHRCPFSPCAHCRPSPFLSVPVLLLALLLRLASSRI